MTFHALSLLLRTRKEGLRVASSITGYNNNINRRNRIPSVVIVYNSQIY